MVHVEHYPAWKRLSLSSGYVLIITESARMSDLEQTQH